MAKLSARAKSLLRLDRSSAVARHSLAASLPPEVLLRIFFLLHQRARFGIDDYGWFHISHTAAYAPTQNVRNLVRVCRAWHGAAMEVLYSCAWLHDEDRCIQFAETLARRPALASLVRRFALPRSAARLPHIDLKTLMTRRSVRKTSSPLWIDLKRAVDRILHLCMHAMDVHLFGAGDDPDKFTGLMLCIPRVTSLFLERQSLSDHLFPILYLSGFRLLIPGNNKVDAQLPHLQDLSLCTFSLGDPLGDNELFLTQFPQFSALRTLRLARCCVRVEWLSNVLICAPNLKTFDWRDNFLCISTLGLVPLVPSDAFANCPEQALTKCIIHSLSRNVKLGSLAFWTSLRVLEITSVLLSEMELLPPHLDTLIIPVWDIHGRLMPRDPWSQTSFSEYRSTVISVTALVKHRLPAWKNCAPELRSVEFWAVVPGNDEVVETWTTAAFLLNSFMKSLHVSLRINVEQVTLIRCFLALTHFRWKDPVPPSRLPRRQNWFEKLLL